MQKSSSKSKLLFITLSCISVGCLFGSFAGNLQKFEVWIQKEKGQFGNEYEQVFLVIENQFQKPWGWLKERAYKEVGEYNDYLFQKVFLLAVGLISSATALVIGDDKLPQLEALEETKKLEFDAQKEYLTRQIKQKWALASEAQKQLFREELKELIALSGGMEETLEANEINETDKFINANYLLQEGHSIDMVVSQTWGYAIGSNEHEEMKAKFAAWMEE